MKMTCCKIVVSFMLMLVAVLGAVVETESTKSESTFEPLSGVFACTHDEDIMALEEMEMDRVENHFHDFDGNKVTPDSHGYDYLENYLTDIINARWQTQERFTFIPMADDTLDWLGGFSPLNSLLRSKDILTNTSMDTTTDDRYLTQVVLGLPDTVKGGPLYRQFEVRIPTVVKGPSTLPGLISSKTLRQIERRKRRRRERRRQRRAGWQHQGNSTWISKSTTKLGPNLGISLTAGGSSPSGLMDGVFVLVPRLRLDPQGSRGIGPDILTEYFGGHDMGTNIDWERDRRLFNTLKRTARKATKKQERRNRGDKETDGQKGKRKKRPPGEKKKKKMEEEEEEEEDSAHTEVIIRFSQQQ